MSFGLTLSHVGIFVTDMTKMVDFYTGFLGFAVSDRGTLADGRGEIVFLTRDAREHHQFVLATGRPENLSYNLINQLSFRVDSLDTLRELQRGLKNESATELGPISHGNALSVYLRDPEGNRVELLIDTPWYVPQPCRIPVDLSLPDDELWAKLERDARALPGFKSRAAWMAEVEDKINEATAKRRREIAPTTA
ncbi:MAG TPA: VOC family protein [Burkholderiales bacterium]|nr:VOC family protein [Burkholderiales bacterium]